MDITTETRDDHSRNFVRIQRTDKLFQATAEGIGEDTYGILKYRQPGRSLEIQFPADCADVLVEIGQRMQLRKDRALPAAEAACGPMQMPDDERGQS